MQPANHLRLVGPVTFDDGEGRFVHPASPERDTIRIPEIRVMRTPPNLVPYGYHTDEGQKLDRARFQGFVTGYILGGLTAFIGVVLFVIVAMGH